MNKKFKNTKSKYKKTILSINKKQIKLCERGKELNNRNKSYKSNFKKV